MGSFKCARIMVRPSSPMLSTKLFLEPRSFGCGRNAITLEWPPIKSLLRPYSRLEIADSKCLQRAVFARSPYTTKTFAAEIESTGSRYRLEQKPWASLTPSSFRDLQCTTSVRAKSIPAETWFLGFSSSSPVRARAEAQNRTQSVRLPSRRSAHNFSSTYAALELNRSLKKSITSSCSQERSGYFSNSSMDGFELMNKIGAVLIRPDHGSGR